MSFIRLILILCLFFTSLPVLAGLLFEGYKFPHKEYIHFGDIETAKKYAFSVEPIKSIDMTPYKDFLIDSDYIEIMKLMKEGNIYKTLLKDNPYRTMLYKDKSNNDFYGYAKYYLNNLNVIYSYSMSGELENIIISQPANYPKRFYKYSNEGKLIEVIIIDSHSPYYRFKPNGDFIEYILLPERNDNLIVSKENFSTNSEIITEIKKQSTPISKISNKEIIFSQGRKKDDKINDINFSNEDINSNEKILNHIVFTDYTIWMQDYTEPHKQTPWYDVNTARNYVMQGEQPPLTIDMSEYKDYMFDKDREEIFAYNINYNNKMPKNYCGGKIPYNNKCRVRLFYYFNLFTGFYAKQYINSNIVFYYNIQGKLQKLEIRPKETIYGSFVKKAPNFPLKSYFYSPDGKLMFINLIMNENACFMFKQNGDFYSFWNYFLEFYPENYSPTGLEYDTIPDE